MKTVKVYHYDAFSNTPNKGNPAGIVLNGEELSEAEMQEIAYKVGFNETAFPVKSEVADIKIRFFTPGHEMDLCGHATMATIFALKSQNLLGDKSALLIETNAGVLTVNLTETDGELLMTMEQAHPQFKVFKGSKAKLAQAIGVEETDFHPDYPIVYGSTGTWTLLVPITHLTTFNKMLPLNALFPEILVDLPKASVHPFCLETYDNQADMHARHFSSPFSGTVEDPVTGTASGVMGAYFAKYINKNLNRSFNLVVEQGHELGKDGRVMVHVRDNEIKITGTAVFVKAFEVELGS